MFGALGRAMARWRWAVLAGWLVLVVVGAAFGGQVFDRLASTDNLRPDSESQQADRRVQELKPEGDKVVAVIRDRDIYDPPLVENVQKIAGEIRGIDGVKTVDDLYSAPGGRIGADNRSSLVEVELRPGLADAQRERTEDLVVAALHRIDAPQVLVGGEKLAEREFEEQAIRDAAVGESIALAVLLIVLVLTLGGFVVGLVPLAAALASVAATLLGLLLLTAFGDVGEFTVNVVTLLGIGLAVDYALLMIARFREERANDLTAAPGELLARTTETAGRTVLISGLAVAAAMLGLFAFAEPLLASMALGGAVVVVLATAAGLTAVPALIAVAHRRIPAEGTRHWILDRLPRPRKALLPRLAVVAQARPGPVALAVSVGLIVLSLPFVLGANLANSDARALPARAEARQLYEVVQRDFNVGRAEPVVVVVDADPATAAVRDLLNQLNSMPGVVLMQPRPDVPGRAAIIDVTPEGATGDQTSRDLVRQIRALNTPVSLLVGGPAAELVDYQESVAGRLPIAVLVLFLVTAILLFVLTGSLVIPVKALLMNALTLLGTLGVLVVVFQWGVGDVLLGFDSWGAIDVTTPVLLFVFIFGLSMDYEVFLLARIKEEWDRRVRRRRSSDDAAASDRAVLAGITKTGPVVTAAALSISVVFLGFLLGGLTAVKEIGFGMVVAVVLDVTVVRGLLLPALMSLLGEWNWWAPAPLRRLHQRWFASGARVRATAAVSAPRADSAPKTTIST
ncbi:putative membrane protein [Asanoa ishikariensis]|uniref:Putative drug exporter of the RND superfamily n=1 Tax=Asanoa ishikariensis TaxID=137265 RepID=A0A1H3KDM8_9ACTN|nr:MMPL family transporter [Asanoa ishikariensis]GIF70402.1 putative membrane protein [Asanoa ishikariensis]SDY50069.1 putative drug exporter of the RND superfamily [Asanoa ishikariensis]